MAFYDWVFNTLGLREWCGADASDAPATMAELLAKARGESATTTSEGFPFPSLDNLNKSCPEMPRTRELTAAVEDGFLAVKDALKFVLDPITQPLSWLLDGALYTFATIPWFILIPILVAVAWYVSRSVGVAILVALTFLFFGIVDHLDVALQTLSIIFVCTALCILLGIPIGIAMSKSNLLQKLMIPLLDLLQTLPSFVYLIPLIFLFSVTEPKLYGIAIILYAIVPVIRLTDLGIRLVDPDVIEAVNAFGMSNRQKLIGVEFPLALPNIMAGVNQTIMMSLSMVVIASLVSAPGLGVLVLRGIRNLELGVGLVAGLGIVLLAVILDRTSKAALARINVSHKSE